jgi:hypothetical protein
MHPRGIGSLPGTPSIRSADIGRAPASRLALGAAIALTLLAVPSPTALAQFRVSTFTNFTWLPYDHGVCLFKADEALGRALAALAADVDPEPVENGLRAAAVGGNLDLRIHCIPDEPMALLAGGGGRAVLVAVTVTTILGDLGVMVRDFLVACMREECPALPAGTWVP